MRTHPQGIRKGSQGGPPRAHCQRSAIKGGANDCTLENGRQRPFVRRRPGTLPTAWFCSRRSIQVALRQERVLISSCIWICESNRRHLRSARQYRIRMCASLYRFKRGKRCVTVTGHKAKNTAARSPSRSAPAAVGTDKSHIPASPASDAHPGTSRRCLASCNDGRCVHFHLDRDQRLIALNDEIDLRAAFGPQRLRQPS